MTVAYPGGLSAPTVSLSGGPTDGVTRLAFTSRSLRPVGGAGAVIVKGTLTWDFLPDEYATFLAWWEGTALYGQEPFTVTVDLGGGAQEHTLQATETLSVASRVGLQTVSMPVAVISRGTNVPIGWEHFFQGVPAQCPFALIPEQEPSAREAVNFDATEGRSTGKTFSSPRGTSLNLTFALTPLDIDYFLYWYEKVCANGRSPFVATWGDYGDKLYTFEATPRFNSQGMRSTLTLQVRQESFTAPVMNSSAPVDKSVTREQFDFNIYGSGLMSFPTPSSDPLAIFPLLTNTVDYYEYYGALATNIDSIRSQSDEGWDYGLHLLPGNYLEGHSIYSLRGLFGDNFDDYFCFGFQFRIESAGSVTLFQTDVLNDSCEMKVYVDGTDLVIDWTVSTTQTARIPRAFTEFNRWYGFAVVRDPVKDTLSIHTNDGRVATIYSPAVVAMAVGAEDLYFFGREVTTEATIAGDTYPVVFLPDGKEWIGANVKWTGAGRWYNGGGVDDGYGRLYYRTELTSLVALLNDGWRCPSEAEWQALFTAIGGTGVAGGKLKEVGTTHWNSPNAGAVDAFGFRLLGAGSSPVPGVYHQRGDYAYCWCRDDGYSLAFFETASDNASVGAWGNVETASISIRLVRDPVGTSPIQLRSIFMRGRPFPEATDLRKMMAPESTNHAYFCRLGTCEAFEAQAYALSYYDDHITLRSPYVANGTWAVQVRRNKSASPWYPFHIVDQKWQQEPIHFIRNSTTLRQLQDWFYASHGQWGGANGGVRSENVYLHDGYIRCRGLGDNYVGPILGIDKKGNPSGINKTIGGVLATKRFFGPGTFEVKCRIPTQTGGVFAIWTFHYEEAYPGEYLYDKILADGIDPLGNEEEGFYAIRNHEIDIETPVRPNGTGDPTTATYDWMANPTWRGEDSGSYTSRYTDIASSNIDDGNFHTYKIVWELDPTPSVKFYIDGVLKRTASTNIPDIPGRFEIGIWYPRGSTPWAGPVADYEEAYVDIEELHIIPAVSTVGVRNFGESYPKDDRTETYHTFQEELPTLYIGTLDPGADVLKTTLNSGDDLFKTVLGLTNG